MNNQANQTGMRASELPTDAPSETIEQPPEQKKVPRLRHGMTLKIGNENFKVIRPGKKLNVILKYMG